MKIREYRELSFEDLRLKIVSLQENLFKLRCNHTVGQLPDSSQLKKGRQEVARAKFVLSEKMKSKEII